MDPAFFQQFPEMVEDSLSPQEHENPPKEVSSNAKALVPIPQTPSSAERGFVRDAGDRRNSSASFGGFSMPAHWVSKVMAGLPDGL
jgi:hypothetical protein